MAADTTGGFGRRSRSVNFVVGELKAEWTVGIRCH